MDSNVMDSEFLFQRKEEGIQKNQFCWEVEDGMESVKIYCKNCNAWITTPLFKITVQSAFSHIFQNPAGVVYGIGCFSQAPGCLEQGSPTPENSWFKGYLWNFALCGKCSVHLGWKYHGNGGSFWGLILDNLIEL